MADGITPGKVDQAYVLRRLIRRMIREARKLGVNGLFTAKLAEVVIRGYKEFYPELEANSRQILEEFTREEEQFPHIFRIRSSAAKTPFIFMKRSVFRLN